MSISRVVKSRYGLYAGHQLPQELSQLIASSASDGSIDVFNPATGDLLSTVTTTSRRLVDATVLNADRVFRSGVWSRAPVQQRSRALTRLARSLEENIPRFALMESMQTGRAVREMNAQLGRLPEWLDYYAALLRTHQAFITPTQGQLLNYVQRVPLGVVAQITPFNHPLLIAIKKIVPALAAGNSAIVKPSELAPASVLEFAELAEEAGIPSGVLSVLPGTGREVGSALASNPLVRKVDITASTRAGRELGAIVGPNLASYTAELGGKAPIVVFDDADLEAAVNGVAFACFVASGQTCVSGARIIIQDGIYDRFMDGLVCKTKDISRRIGNPLNPQSTMGTVISPQHLERISCMVQKSAHKVRIGGHRILGPSPLDGFNLSKGCFYAPTIIEDISQDDELWTEEIFGPVAVMKRFSSEEEGVTLANDSKYGLGAGIWSNDLSRAHRISSEIQAGLVWVNTHHRNDPSSPWGGMKESGIGRENGIEAFNAYTQSKSTIVNTAKMDEARKSDDWFANSTNEKRYG
ncbi:aldehyde dehydrogenase [Schizopora paradoxa]|uniref:Aldehyde dehydrogenase n=1 Tax=Schizopora paradoxa TaxID=27342 RepID=A0A0H2RV07_9AGAM|nr:aldehyde dehydrogenase [Schizopora paradoxa]